MTGSCPPGFRSGAGAEDPAQALTPRRSRRQVRSLVDLVSGRGQRGARRLPPVLESSIIAPLGILRTVHARGQEPGGNGGRRPDRPAVGDRSSGRCARRGRRPGSGASGLIYSSGSQASEQVEQFRVAVDAQRACRDAVVQEEDQFACRAVDGDAGTLGGNGEAGEAGAVGVGGEAPGVVAGGVEVEGGGLVGPGASGWRSRWTGTPRCRSSATSSGSGSGEPAVSWAS